MLTRLYIDNFRAFVEFEYRPARRELILGGNGTGKSSLFDVLLLVRQIASRGYLLDDFSILKQRTRWLNRKAVTFEIDAVIDGREYGYRLVIEPWGDPPQPRIASETVRTEGRPMLEFTNGEVRLFDDRFEFKTAYELDWRRSAFATILPGRDKPLRGFKDWLNGCLCFRLNPFAMRARAEEEMLYPDVDLSNFASWYRHLLQTDQKGNASLLQSLRSSLPGFEFLHLEPAGENVRLLVAEFRNGSRTDRFSFDELSDGQRNLIALYTLLHFAIAKGYTVVVDEPDNFLALREIQPWLTAVTDLVEDGRGQVLLVSHHPEILNQWAPSNGVQFFRDESGPIRVAKFEAERDSCLTPAELIARGWERE